MDKETETSDILILLNLAQLTAFFHLPPPNPRL